MIIKSIRVRARGRGQEDLLTHLLHGEENELVRVLRGTVADVRDAFSDAQRHARVYAIRHIIVAPAVATSTSEMLGVVDRLAVEFGFDPASAAIVEHRKSKADATRFPGHLHVLVAEVDPASGRVLSSAHSYPRQEKVAREVEHALGHPFVQGAHHHAVLSALRAASKTEVADALDRAFPEPDASPRPRAAYSDAAHRQAKRAGLDLPIAKKAVADAWRATTTRPALEAALAAHGLVARLGDKGGTWVIETRDGTFVGSLPRLAGARKFDVTTRMEKTDDRSVHPREAGPRHDGDGHLPQHQEHPSGHPAPRQPRPGSPGVGDGGRPGGHAPRHPASPGRGSGTPQGELGGSARPPERAEPGSSDARRREGLTRPKATAEAVGLMLGLDHPDRILLLHDLKAAANAGAKPDAERALDSLLQLRDDARYTQVMARSGVLAEPESLKVAQREAGRAERAAATARTEAASATQTLSDHRTAPPRWRRTWGRVTGASARHRTAEAALLTLTVECEGRVAEAEGLSRKAAEALKQATDRHTVAARSFREGWQVQATHAAERIAAVEAALELLHLRPELAWMGPGGLLKTGYRVTEIQNRAVLDQGEELDLAVKGPGWP